MKRDVFIYGLFDGDRCIYVGRTRNPVGREDTHSSTFLRKLGIVVAFHVLSMASDSDASSAERAMIKKYKELGQADFNKPTRPPSNKGPVNLSVAKWLKNLVQIEAFKERRSVSALTEQLWREELSVQGITI